MRISLFPILTIACLILSSCQTPSQVSPLCSRPPSPRIPQVIGRVPISAIGLSRAMIANAYSGYTYVATGNYITAIKGTEGVKLSVGGGDAVSIASDENDGTVYVVNNYGDSVTVIRGTEVLGIVPTIGKDPRSIAVESKSGFAYIVSDSKSRPLTGDAVEGNVMVLKGTEVIDNLKLGRLGLRFVATDPVGGYVYVGGGSAEGDMVAVLKDRKEIARYNTRELEAMNVNQCTGEVYAFAHGGLYRFKDGNLVDWVEPKYVPRPEGQVVAHPITGEVYLSYSGAFSGKYGPFPGKLLVFKDMKEVGEVEMGPGSTDIAIDPLTGNVYAANYGTTDVLVLNGSRIVTTIPIGGYPDKIVVNSTNGWVYALTMSNGTATILGYPENKPYPPYP